MQDGWKNQLYFGDNLEVMRKHIPDESVDLIYLDPPFNSKATYNILFEEKDGAQSPAQITAFEDTWHWDLKAEEAYKELATVGPKKLSDLIQALRQFLGQNDMMAYLVMMAIRLAEMHRVLKQTGSIYLHCDPTASHYIKVILDSVFDNSNFRNELVWHYGGRLMHNRYKWNAKHDVIFYYAKSQQTKLKVITEPWSREEFIRVKKQAVHIDKHGREYIWQDAGRGKPKAYKRYIDEVLKKGKALDDVWDIKPLTSSDGERLGYPTQKPEALLERIIEASSKKGNVVLDPFCGCGTTVAVAERLNRRWVGIDITHLAITLMKQRLEDTFDKELTPYKVIGEPTDIGGAKALALENRFQFEWWALGQIGARPAGERRKGADSGVDGYIKFFDDDSGEAKTVIVQVKSGGVNRAQIATLKGDMEREEAVIAVFITLQNPTKPMRREAAAAGFYESKYLKKDFPRVQILTIEEILSGKEAAFPKLTSTFRKAKRKSKGKEIQGRIL